MKFISATPTNTGPFFGKFTWVLVLTFSGAPTITFGGGQPLPVSGFYPPIPCPADVAGKQLLPWTQLDTTGTITLLCGEPGDRMPQGASSSASTVKLYDSNGNAIATDGAGRLLVDIGQGLSPAAVAGATVNSGDAVVLNINGNDFATLQFTTSAVTGTGSHFAETSGDGGVNWRQAPMGKRLDAVSANPTFTLFNPGNITVNQVWEIPIPGDTTQFRVRNNGPGTGATFTITPRQRFVPGVPVVAVLYDVTSGVNTALDTGILDTVGWTSLSVTALTPAGGSATIKNVDDAGANPAANVVSIPASAGIVLNLSPSGATAAAVGTSGSQSVAWRWRRTQATSAAVAALTSRLRIEAYR